MDQSKQQSGWWRRTSAGLAVLIALALPSPLARAETAESAPVELQLEVQINGFPVHLVAAFFQMADGRVASPRSELTELGIKVPGEGPADEVIVLDDLKGISYVYDDSAQTIEIEVPNAARIARILETGKGDSEVPLADSSTGLVVNYTAYGSVGYDMPTATAIADGASLSLDARAFSKFGVLQQTGTIGTTTFSDFTMLRLNSTWSYTSPESMRTYRMGDVVSSGLGWTRPIRIGGAQVARNFSARPDLITMPLPEFQGSAEVPSTLKIFIGGNEAYSGSVDPGPFRLDNLPVFTAEGTARVVLTDSTGREQQTEQEFFTSPDLLRRGLADYSFEAGLPRLGYGVDSLGYDMAPVGVASLRYGLTNSLTLEAHAEGSETLIEGGMGALFQARHFGMFNVAAAASLYQGDSGVFLHAGWEGHLGDLGASLTSERTFGHFYDLAAVTERPPKGVAPKSGVARELDQISLNYALSKLKAGAGISFIHRLGEDDRTSLIVSGTYSQNFSNDITGFVTGFADFGDTPDYGVFIGGSLQLGHDITTSAGITAGKSGWNAGVEASRPAKAGVGNYGWRVAHSEGDASRTTVMGTYRASKARLEANISQSDLDFKGNATMEGSVVAAGGGIFLGNQIWDSFAIVDAGAPDVPVAYENRPAGVTGSNGKLLLTDLRAYQRNRVAIDVTALPIGASVAENETIIVPREKSGVVVNFGVSLDGGAIVILQDSAGKFIHEGSEVTLDGATDSFVMGYDGQVYLTGLASHNRLTAKQSGKDCSASFDFVPDPQTVTTVGPLTCQ